VEGTAGKVAIITGGATGLGAGLVRAFQSSGVLVAFADIKDYERFLHETAFKLPGVTHVRSRVVLREIKAETRLPIEESAPPPVRRRR